MPGREATGTAITAAVKYPFPGLRPFRENEEHLFFGRESQVDRMVDKLARTRFLAVVGSSGSGKSSLVNCGLKPALRRGLMARAGTSWRMAQFRPGSDPIQAMACALSKEGVLFKDFAMDGLTLPEMVAATLEMSKLGLLDLYDQAQKGERTNLLVVVDQFEELFRYRRAASGGDEYASDEESVAFVNLLLEGAAATDYPLYVVLTMRSDFLGDCAQFPGLPEAINEGQYLVPRMTREERRAAITGPAAVGGGEISPVLLTRLVNDVGDNPDQLSILQHALNRTWAYWQHNANTHGELTLQHYEAIGTMANALDQHAEEAYAELGDDRQKKICEKIFQALTDKGSDARGIRRPTTLELLCALSEASPAEVKGVIEVFRKPSRSFLMPPRPEPLEPQTVIDISHESLMRVWRRLKSWVEEEADSAASYRRLAQNAALREKGATGLMTDPELSLTLDWRDKWRPNAAWAGRYYPGFDHAVAFLEESRAARDAAIRAENERRRRELRRARVWAAILLVFFCVASGFAIFGFIERGKAKAAQQALQDTLQTVKQANVTAQSTEQNLQEAENEETAAEAALKSDTAARKGADVIAQDRSNLAAAQQKLETAKVAAAMVVAQAAAVNANGTIIDPSTLSTNDLFDVSQGVQITNADSEIHNPKDMLGGTDLWSGSPEIATFFADGKASGARHTITWRTKEPVSVASVALFAAEDPDNKRAFKRFTLYAGDNAKSKRLVLYAPTLPYGGPLPSCGSGRCHWPQSAPAGSYSGTALSVCLEVSPVTPTREFTAEFVQAGNGLGPRIVQLDGYSRPNCAK